MHLIGITNNGIVAHGVEDTTLFVQLELEMIVPVHFKIDASNHPTVELVASEAGQPVIRDIHAKASEQFRPLGVNAEGCGLIASHQNDDDRMQSGGSLEFVSCGFVVLCRFFSWRTLLVKLNIFKT
jgi:hypothetical protein